ncbi:MAG: hypothetical protein P0Y53_01505 [Candidatus Pseudobacter hemicellulosilyticus]|uniref:Uncharacterized protein n=1 Tax=Candidatus Pseudobacter hemicellulosilyticus TaxID=3121375 RepID=A0AAJ5WU24_9BACT|nr:MAG: hypothetical protein P0Y53_01505 [Pseudobacter sp.]
MEWLDSPAAKTDHPTLPISDISTQKYQHETLLKECYAFIIYFTEKTNIVEDFDLFGDEPYKEDDWDFDEEVEAFANVGMHYENAKIREILAECEKRKSGVDFEESQYNMDQSV